MRYLELNEWSLHSKKIDTILKSKGYKLLGRGVDMSAWREPGTDMVLKIFGTKRTTDATSKQKKVYFSNEHRMFFSWVKFCEGRNNPFLPKYYGFESFEFEGRVYLQIKTEFLTKVPSNKLAECLEGLGYNAPWFSWKQFERDELSYNTDREQWMPLLNIMTMDQFKYLFDTISALHKLSKKYNYKLDLHSQNFMMRGKTPVINDPWVIPGSIASRQEEFI